MTYQRHVTRCGAILQKGISRLAIADTHALIWYLCNDERLSDRAKDMFEMAIVKNESIGISTISLIELIYLTEKKRIPDTALDNFRKEQDSESSILQIISLNSNISFGIRNIERDSVPEMPDRIIAATALHFSLPLITRDHKIQHSIVDTIW